MPSTVMRPSVGLYNPARSLAIVVFPALFTPTIASAVPAGIVRSMSRSTSMSVPG